MKKKKIFVGIIAILIMAAFFYTLRNKGKLEKRVEIVNKTSEEISSVALADYNKIIFQKTDGKDYYFPKSLTQDMDEVFLITITKDQKIIKSDLFKLDKNRKVAIEKLDEKMKLDVDTKKDNKKIEIPDVKNWKIKADDKNIKSSFKADTKLEYTLYVMGKGGELGISDSNKNNNVVKASWDIDHRNMDSWVVFKK